MDTLNIKFQHSKRGNGSFTVIGYDDGRVMTSIYENSNHKFENAREAYEYHFAKYCDLGLHSHWNICYHLADHL